MRSGHTSDRARGLGDRLGRAFARIPLQRRPLDLSVLPVCGQLSSARALPDLPDRADRADRATPPTTRSARDGAR